MSARARMAAVFVIALAAGHLLTLSAVPRMIMARAMSLMETRGFDVHEFALTPRLTPQSQTVVRPSPDLAYSVCPYDFSRTSTALAVRAGVWAGYGSISFFDASTNNFATVRVDDDMNAGASVAVLLAPPGQNLAQLSAVGVPVIQSPSRRGVILIRRIAPTAEDYAGVQAVAAVDSCAPLAPPPGGA